MNKKNALILGVTGQGGSFMAKFLLKKNYNVFGLVRKSATGNLNNIEEIVNNKKFKILHGDLLDLNSVANAIQYSKASQIYNFADQDHVGWSYEIPSYSLSVTAFAVIEILELIKNNFPKIKYFQPLSSNMFGGSKSKSQNESEPLTPRSIYALGKVTAFHACELYKKTYNLKIYSAIFYNHESEIRPDEYVTRKITKSVVRIFYGKQKNLKLGNIKAKIDWGYAGDYVEASYKIMQQKNPDFFIIGSGKTYTIEYFVKKCFEYVGLDYKKFVIIDRKLFRPTQTTVLKANINKARKIIKFKPKIDINKLISIMMENDLNAEKRN